MWPAIFVGLLRGVTDLLVAPGRPIDDPGRLWRGEYQSCPYCGTLNEPAARRCYNCRGRLLNFSEADSGPPQ